MNIWILKDGDPIPELDQGERMLRSGIIAEYLQLHGCKVTLWTSTWSHQKKAFRGTSDTRLTLESGIKLRMIHSLGYKKNISLSRIRHNKILAKKFVQQASSEQERPDIIISSLPTVDFCFSGMRMAMDFRVPFVADLRDKWPDIFVEIFKFPLNKAARLCFHEQFVKMKALLLSQFTDRDFRALCRMGAKIRKKAKK